jgi:hypothetical protein
VEFPFLRVTLGQWETKNKKEKKEKGPMGNKKYNENEKVTRKQLLTSSYEYEFGIFTGVRVTLNLTLRYSDSLPDENVQFRFREGLDIQ